MSESAVFLESGVRGGRATTATEDGHVIEVNFSLHNEDGTPSEQVTRTLPQVAAMGEMIGLPGLDRSYQIIDVL